MLSLKYKKRKEKQQSNNLQIGQHIVDSSTKSKILINVSIFTLETPVF